MTNAQEPRTPTIAAQIEALAACPFCVSDFPIVPSRDKQGFVVICTGCSALGPTRTTQADAIAAWNTRPAIVTALRQAEAAPPADAAMPTWANVTDDQRERLTLLAEVELHLQSSRIFLTSREKMHPCGVAIHDELLVKVSVAIDAIGRERAK